MGVGRCGGVSRCMDGWREGGFGDTGFFSFSFSECKSEIHFTRACKLKLSKLHFPYSFTHTRPSLSDPIS